MDITLHPRKLLGTVSAPPSKSMAHRLLICAAFQNKATTLVCPNCNEDIEATAECLHALGANIQRTSEGYVIGPFHSVPTKAVLNCRESGSTLRFLLPIAGALGIETTFQLGGRLPRRPLSPLWEEMERMGCQLSRPDPEQLLCRGKLRPGAYNIGGSVSSQFISGLMMALPLINGETSLSITGRVESRPYIDMTQEMLARFADGQADRIEVEGDWSSAAFWLAAEALGSNVDVSGLNLRSVQGDRCITELLPKLEKNTTISAADIPDLIPVLSIVAAANKGAEFTDIRRLRLKESDRVASILAMIKALGGHAEATDNTLTIRGTGLQGGAVDSFGDHRIAMAAAIGATVCTQPVTILSAECVRKSYPTFWEEYAQLGGTYEKHLW